MPDQYKRSPRIAWRQYEEETLVITPDDRKVHKLNATGSFLWNEIGEEGADERKLLSRMSASFEADEKTLKADIKGFLKDLTGKGVLMKEQG
jgi:hypothetical protein